MEFILNDLPKMIDSYSGYKIRSGSRVKVDKKNIKGYTILNPYQKSSESRSS